MSEQRAPVVHVVALPREAVDPALTEALRQAGLPEKKLAKYSQGRSKAVDTTPKCSYVMTVGSRKNARGGRKRGSYSVEGKAKRVPCPKNATRTINGQRYCDVHGPATYRIDPYYATRAWKTLRKNVLERDGHACRYCGKVAQTADHVVPRSKGGTDSLSNLVACCRPCNKIAGGQVFSSFAVKKRWILQQKR